MSGPLRGREIFVEIFNEEENISSAFQTLVTSLGGTWIPALKKSVDVLVWRKGRQWIWTKAKKYSITTVTPLWLEACERDKTFASPSSFRPPDPNFDLLVKRPRRAFTSPGRNLPGSKRAKPVPSTVKREHSPPLSAAKAKIDFSDTSTSGEDDAERKVFICGEANSELEAELRLIGAKTTSKPGSADLALLLDPEAVESIAVALICKLQLVESAWLKDSCEAQSWLSPEKFCTSAYKLTETLFSDLRFSGDQELLAHGLVGRLLAAAGGTVVSHPREGDYFVTESEPPRLPSHIKVVGTEWVARCITKGSIIREDGGN